MLSTLLALALITPGQTTTYVKGPLSLGGLASDPSSPANGWMYFNSTSKRFRCWVDTGWRDCVNAVDIEAQTVTVAANGDSTKATFNVDPSTSTVVVECQDTDGCIGTFQETSALRGRLTDVCSTQASVGYTYYNTTVGVAQMPSTIAIDGIGAGECFGIKYTTADIYLVTGIGSNSGVMLRRGAVMTGQLVFDGLSTDITTSLDETLTLAPSGIGGIDLVTSTGSTRILSGDPSVTNIDWQDASFNYSTGATYGIRLISNNIDFTSNTYLTWQPGNIRASTLTLAVQTTNNPITLTGLTQLNGPIARYQGTGSIVGTVNNFSTCTNYSHCRLSGSSTPILTGMTVLAVAEERTLCNYGTTTIVLSHEDSGSTAANRFNLPGAVNYDLIAYKCVTAYWDNGLSRWLIN